jgi:hypothetical protein
MRRFSAAWVLAALFAVLMVSLLVGCSGTNATATSTVTKIVLTPSYLSLNPGEVERITATAQNSAGSTVVADVRFSSSSSTQVTVSPSGLVCAGTWDANYINCNALHGQAAVGTATITATSGTVIETATVYAHIQADRAIVDPTSGCVSVGATPTYTATVYNTTSPGCSAVNPCDITATVGPITFISTDLQVMSNNATSGVLTATAPGGTGIYAQVSGLNSVPQSALVCLVVSIQVHDAASSNTSFNLAVGGTQALIADVVDSNGVAIKPTLTWSSLPSGSASVALTPATSTVPTSPIAYTVTSIAPGTAIVTASCSTPTCNRNVSPHYGQNLVSVTTSGGSTTTVYAASTNSLSLVPIPTSTNTPGTPIALPFQPNSMVSSLGGTKLYLGSSSALMIVDTATGGVTTSAVPGQILAISPDSNYLLISNSAGTATYLYSLANSTAVYAQSVTATAAAFTPDSHSASFLAGQQLYYDTVAPTNTITNLPQVPNAIDISGQGGVMYITSSTAGAIDVRSTCDQSEWQTLAGKNPTLVAHIPNGTGAVVVDAPSVDVVTTGTINTGCPANPQNSVNTYDLGAGDFNARQIFFSLDSSRAWILTDQSSVISFNLSALSPTLIPLVNNTQAYSGGITMDGSKVYVGAKDNNVHMLDVSSSADSAQIAVGLKDANSNPVAPNLVVVLPH